MVSGIRDELCPEGQAYTDDELRDALAAFLAEGDGAAGEFALFALALADQLDVCPRLVAETLRRSVELAFPRADAYKAALDLYVLEKRGRLTGHGTSGELIRELVRARS